LVWEWQLMASKNLLKPIEMTEDRHSSIPHLTMILFIAVSFLFFGGVKPAFAGELRVPLPIWLLIEGWRVGAFAVIQFWGFLGFVVFVPLKRIILGVVLTLGGAFLPDIPMGKNNPGTGSATVGKISFKGAPRYAVLVVGILIVSSSLWEGISEFSK
jgi:hypothetical protein